MSDCFHFHLVPIVDGKYMCDSCEKVFSLQPEYSNPEDLLKECEEMGHAYTWMPKEQALCVRCGNFKEM